MKISAFIITLLVMLFSLNSCKRSGGGAGDNSKGYANLEEIRKRGKLRILVLYSSTTYFMYRGQSMGYEYEMAAKFAESIGVEPEVVVAENVDRLIELLREGKGDLIAHNLPITNELKDTLNYCGRQDITHQVLVQRRQKGLHLLRDVPELIGKTVYVVPNSRYHQRLIHLNQELGGGVNIHLIRKDTIATEDLIEMVSEGKIPYTVADVNVAQLNKTYFENIDIQLKISFPQRLSWAVMKENTSLANALNKWYSTTEKRSDYLAIAKRYFEQSKRYGKLVLPRIIKGHVSRYDEIFKKYAPQLEWDWQLLAAMAYVESEFDPNAESWAGAKGLMQMMPRTATSVGIYNQDIYDPEINVRGAVKYLRNIRQAYLKIPDPLDRDKFILGAYNAGIGHIMDAQALAKKYGKNRVIWDNHVANYVILKSNPDYYSDEVCKFGYLRGEETYVYVKKVMKAYQYYLSKTPHQWTKPQSIKLHTGLLK